MATQQELIDQEFISALIREANSSCPKMTIPQQMPFAKVIPQQLPFAEGSIERRPNMRYMCIVCSQPGPDWQEINRSAFGFSHEPELVVGKVICKMMINQVFTCIFLLFVGKQESTQTACAGREFSGVIQYRFGNILQMDALGTEFNRINGHIDVRQFYKQNADGTLADNSKIQIARQVFALFDCEYLMYQPQQPQQPSQPMSQPPFQPMRQPPSRPMSQSQQPSQPMRQSQQPSRSMSQPQQPSRPMSQQSSQPMRQPQASQPMRQPPASQPMSDEEMQRFVQQFQQFLIAQHASY
jgi:hypothetical protein